MGFQKNVAGQKWLVFAFDRTDGSPKAGDAAQITAKIRKDYGTANATDDVNPTEIEDGFYEFTLLTAESDANVMDLLPESSTADIQVIGVPARVFTIAPNSNALGIETDGDITKVNLCAANSDMVAAAPTAAAIDTELTSTHGSGAWTTGGVSGSNTVTINVDDSLSADLPDVFVDILSSGDVLLSSGTTDSSGQLVVTLDDATYKVRLRKAGFAFTVTETLVVSGTTSDTYVGTAVIPALPAPDLQTLFGAVALPDLTGGSGAVITATPVGLNQDISSQVLSLQVLSDTTDSGGAWALSLAKTGKFKITGVLNSVEFLSIEITVTATDTVDIVTYIGNS